MTTPNQVEESCGCVYTKSLVTGRSAHPLISMCAEHRAIWKEMLEDDEKVDQVVEDFKHKVDP